EYAQIRDSGFDELGGDGFGLKSGALTTARWQAGLGLRASRDWQLARGGSLSLQGRLAWQQSFGLRGEAFDASFTGMNQWAPLGGVAIAHRRRGFRVGARHFQGRRPRVVQPMPRYESATAAAPAAIALDIRKADHAPLSCGCANSGGNQTSTVMTPSIAASSVAARRGHNANRRPMAVATLPAPVRYAQPCRQGSHAGTKPAVMSA